MFSRLLIPDTVDYMIAGYVVIAVGIGIYLISIGLRWKKALQAYKQYQNDHEQ